jgi:hypothetical protein
MSGSRGLFALMAPFRSARRSGTSSDSEGVHPALGPDTLRHFVKDFLGHSRPQLPKAAIFLALGAIVEGASLLLLIRC